MIQPYYSDDAVMIYHGDALEILGDALVSLMSFDLVLTDPPYNLGIDYDTHDDEASTEGYEAWCRRWYALLPKRKTTIIFPGLSNLPMWCRIDQPLAVGCWHIPGNPGRGFPWSFVEWEPFLYWGGFMGGSNVYRARVTAQQDIGDHPCPKPLSLFRGLIERSKASTVLDPFMGSGTTLRAAKDLGRKAIGIELSERYCEIAAKRMGQEVLDLGGVA